MAKNKKVELENIALKPQELGKVYKKKSNIGRVIFIFIVMFLVVFYINDISFYINNLLGKQSSSSILDNREETKKKENNNVNNNEINFYEYSESLEITNNIYKINNFKKENNILSFDFENISSTLVDFSKDNYFIELYNENKTLLQRIKVDFGEINTNSKVNKSINYNNDFSYIVILSKKESDYPNVELTDSKLTCTSNNEEIIYSFLDNKLNNIKHNIESNNENEKSNLIEYVNKYNSINGVSAIFTEGENSYKAVIAINYYNVNDKLDNKYYFDLNTLAKVINFEMESYGFDCN